MGIIGGKDELVTAEFFDSVGRGASYGSTETQHCRRKYSLGLAPRSVSKPIPRGPFFGGRLSDKGHYVNLKVAFRQTWSITTLKGNEVFKLTGYKRDQK